jgi:hypothetical protein
MKIVKRASAGIVLIVTLSIVLGHVSGHLNIAHAAAQTTGAAPVIPDAIKVPAGNVLLFQAFGRGVQIYNCPTNADSNPTPFTILYSNADQKRIIGTMDRPDGQPRWSDLVGNSVIAVRQVVVPSPNPANVPFVLLKAQAHFGPGNGMLSLVTFIQRVNPNGGSAPVGGCMNKNQAQESLPFSATFLFYKAA